MESVTTRTKLLVSFVAVALGSVVVGGVALSATGTLVQANAVIAREALPSVQALAALHEGVTAMRYHTTKAIAGTLQGDQQKLDASWAQFEQVRKRTQDGIAAYDRLSRSAEAEALWSKIPDAYRAYVAATGKIWESIRAGDGVKADGLQNAGAAAFQADLLDPLEKVEALDAALAARLDAASERKAAGTRRLLWTVMVLTLVGGVAFGVFLALSVSRPLEVLVREALRLRDAVERGELAVRSDPASVSSEFRPVLEGMNATMDAFARPIRVTSEYVARIARGDLPPRIDDAYQGDFDITKRNLNGCIDAVTALVADTTMLFRAAVEGDLRRRVDASRHQGEFRRIVGGVNDTLDAVVGPVQEAAQVLDRVAARDLRARVTGDYRGDHSKMKDAVNATSDALRSALAQVAGAAHQVTAASEQIAASSQAVANGASAQASALEQTSASLESLASATTHTADNAQQAAQLAAAANGAAAAGGSVVGEMADAMARIRRSAEGTSQIIKDINEITFQTNLLALNAAVEAARAGAAGRGFAVVAEEVRSLALRSKEAANKTEELIRESVRDAGAGEATARQVTAKLSDITASVSKVSDIVGVIAASAKEQASGIAQVTAAVAQVDGVTQQNAASSEQSSSAAAELSEQASELSRLLGSFHLGDAARLGAVAHLQEVRT